MSFSTDGKFVYHFGDLVGIPSFNARGIPVGYFITNSHGRYVLDGFGRQLFSPANIIYKPSHHTYPTYQPPVLNHPLPTHLYPRYFPQRSSLSTPLIPMSSSPPSQVPPPLSGPPPPPPTPVISLDYKNFYDETKLKIVLFKWLSIITDTLYSDETKRMLEVDATSANINSENSFLFFVKGGATPSLLLTHYRIKRVGIESDLDSILLINPRNKNFSKFLNILTFQIIKTLKNLISDKSKWPLLTDLYKKYGLVGATGETLIYDTKSGIYADFLRYSNPSINFNILLEPGYLKECPLILEFKTNLTYAGTSFNMAKISLYTKTEPSLNILDISIPIHDYSDYNFFWNTAGLVKYSGRQVNNKGNVKNTHSFYIEDPISYIVDQLYTVKKDTWSNKNPKRINRVKTVKNIVKIVRNRGNGVIFKNRIKTFKNKSNRDEFLREISFDESIGDLLV